MAHEQHGEIPPFKEDRAENCGLGSQEFKTLGRFWSEGNGESSGKSNGKINLGFTGFTFRNLRLRVLG